ncbi:MAG: hypothetical protein EBU66_04660, partial [Bacteroidetes bacterium]|nr:hypothetical protein [Bacteroidota bacterium]
YPKKDLVGIEKSRRFVFPFGCDGGRFFFGRRRGGMVDKQGRISEVGQKNEAGHDPAFAS